MEQGGSTPPAGVGAWHRPRPVGVLEGRRKPSRDRAAPTTRRRIPERMGGNPLWSRAVRLRPRACGEIDMAKDYTTLRVEQAAKSAAEDAKTDDETWSDYILRCADADADVRRFVDADALAGDLAVTVDTDALADAVVAQLDDVGGADAGGSVSLDASERRRIAEEVAEVLR